MKKINSEETKHCPKCNTWKPRSEFYKNRTTYDGLQGKCKQCQKKYQGSPEFREILKNCYVKTQGFFQKRYNQSERGRDVQNKLQKKYKSEHPEHYSAHKAVANAIRHGILERPKRCQNWEDGGEHKGRIESHHHLGYAPEHHLDVQWLCRRCHDIADGYGNKGRNQKADIGARGEFMTSVEE